MIRRFIDLFRRRRIPVIEIRNFVPPAHRDALVEQLKAGKPLVLDGGAKLTFYER